MAQSALGSGKYDDAEREYKVILQLQPGNPDATQGLHKLSLIRNENNR
jgi:TolA-binding protein